MKVDRYNGDITVDTVIVVCMHVSLLLASQFKFVCEELFITFSAPGPPTRALFYLSWWLTCLLRSSSSLSMHRATTWERHNGVLSMGRLQRFLGAERLHDIFSKHQLALNS